jgi:electron transport complex protein RnfD
MMWRVVLALFPVFIASFIAFGFQALRILGIAATTALLTEIGARTLFRKPATVHDGTSLISALLFALLLPPSLPSWTVALGSAFGIFFGKEIFGGLGQNPFNPALVGYAFLLVAFPDAGGGFSETLLVQDSWIGIFTLLLGGAILFGSRVIHWEIPLIYIGSVLGFSAALGHSPGEDLFSGVVLFAALFLVTDPVTTPMTRAGERWFCVVSGLLAALIRPGAALPAALSSGILATNAMNPWLDRWIRPRRSFYQGQKEALAKVKMIRLEPKPSARALPLNFRRLAFELLRWIGFILFVALLLYGLNR